jgi:hypothetical protein
MKQLLVEATSIQKDFDVTEIVDATVRENALKTVEDNQ